MPADIVDSLWISIAAGMVVLLLDAGLKALYARLGNSNPLYRRFRIAAVGVCWVCVNAAYVHLFHIGAALFILISSLGLAWIVFSELDQYWRIGVVGADRQIRLG